MKSKVPMWKKFLQYVHSDYYSTMQIHPSILIETGIVPNRKALHNLLYRLSKSGHIVWKSYPTASPDGIFYEIKLTKAGKDVVKSMNKTSSLSSSTVVENKNYPAFEILVNDNVVLSLSYDEAYAVLDAFKTINDMLFKKFKTN